MAALSFRRPPRLPADRCARGEGSRRVAPALPFVVPGGFGIRGGCYGNGRAIFGGLSKKRRAEAGRCAAAAGGAAAGEDAEFDGEAYRRWNRDVRSIEWDEPPRAWEEDFLYVRTAGIVSETDVNDGSVKAAALKAPRLSRPENVKEWKQRLIANTVYYRQNYAWMAMVILAMHFFSVSLPLVVCVGCFGTSMVFFSPKLLEAYCSYLDSRNDPAKTGSMTSPKADELRSKDQSASAVMFGTISALAANYAVAELRGAAVAALCSLFATLLLILVHATLRPLSLGSSIGKVADNLKKAKSREELAETLREGVGAVGAWANDAAKRAKADSEGFFFVNKVVGDPAAAAAGAAPGSGPQQQAPPSGQKSADDAAIDVDGRDVTNRRSGGTLPPGRT